jgi:WAHD domain of WASH complex
MSTALKIVPTDLARHEESIIQALNGLQHLNNVIQDAFNRVDSRIEKNFKRVEAVRLQKSHFAYHFKNNLFFRRSNGS